MSQNPIHHETARARSLVDGEFVSISRVVDTLLDLRLRASTELDLGLGLVELIDGFLGAIPGRSVVPNSWWLETLDEIDRQAGAGNGHLRPQPA